MSEEAPKYYAVLTDAGAELEARALQEGKGIVLTHIAVGDANLQAVTPDPSVTGLAHEVYRCAIDSRTRDEADKKVMLLHATIPADVGGWWINELGVVGHLDGEDEEVLYAYANHARYYKVLPQDGQSLVHTVTVPIVQCTDAQITINILDEGYATAEQLRAHGVWTQKYFAGGMAHHIRLSDRMTRLELSLASREYPATRIISEWKAGTHIVADIAARDALSGINIGELCQVTDASADPTVESGSAFYIWTGNAWQKLSEAESMDAISTATTLPQSMPEGLSDGGLLTVDID